MKKATTKGRARLRWQFEHPQPKLVDRTVKSESDPDDSRNNRNPVKATKS